MSGNAAAETDVLPKGPRGPNASFSFAAYREPARASSRGLSAKIAGDGSAGVAESFLQMPVQCYLAGPRLAESAPLQDCQSVASGPMAFLKSGGETMPAPSRRPKRPTNATASRIRRRTGQSPPLRIRFILTGAGWSPPRAEANASAGCGRKTA